MNKLHENIAVAVFCPKCGEKHSTELIDQPNISVICHNHNRDYIYFPFGRSIDEMEPQGLCADNYPKTA